jgi:hypothetical protein
VMKKNGNNVLQLFRKLSFNALMIPASHFLFLFLIFVIGLG